MDNICMYVYVYDVLHACMYIHMYTYRNRSRASTYDRTTGVDRHKRAHKYIYKWYICWHGNSWIGQLLAAHHSHMPFAQAGRRKLCNLTGIRTNDVIKSYSGPKSVSIRSISSTQMKLCTQLHWVKYINKMSLGWRNNIEKLLLSISQKLSRKSNFTHKIKSFINSY